MDRLKDIIIFITIMLLLGTFVGCTTTETENNSVRCCVTEEVCISDGLYEITVEYNHNLYTYYDSVPYKPGTVLMVEFNPNFEILAAYETL